MIRPKEFFDLLNKNGVNYYVGVPDSLLKEFCGYVSDNTLDGKHLIAANEGAAIGVAAGHYLATGNPALVYMQNSGIGNAINPLLSLADRDVYGIPMLILIGWRGEPGLKDEPQHFKQGKIQTNLLKALEFPWTILDSDKNKYRDVINLALKTMHADKTPYILLAKKNTFEKYNRNIQESCNLSMSREEAIKNIIEYLSKDNINISTTGMASRELYEIRKISNSSHNKDFLTVGSMGHASAIALGISNAKKDNRICCIDGDGALLMHMGTMANIGLSKNKYFNHIVINNGAHDSVGGQQTCALSISLINIAKSCGYKTSKSISEKNELIKYLKELNKIEGPNFLEIRTKKGARDNLGRPSISPSENKKMVMDCLK